MRKQIKLERKEMRKQQRRERKAERYKLAVMEQVEEGLEFLVRRPKKNGLHLVLDLDNTIIHSVGLDDDIMAPDFYSRAVSCQTKARPFLRLFLQVCFAVFESVSVWTAGTPDYKEYIIDGLSRKHYLKDYFACEYDRSDCERLRTDPYIDDPEDKSYTKRLAWLSIEHSEIGMNDDNTFIIDDNVYYSRHNTNRAIPIPPWESHMDNDVHLLLLASKFLSVRDEVDMMRVVSEYWQLRRK